MKRNFLISIWMTLATTVLLGIGYPLAVTRWRSGFFRGKRTAK